MCEECNQLFDKAFNGVYLATGMYATKEEQKKNLIEAKYLSEKLGYNGLFEDNNCKTTGVTTKLEVLKTRTE